MSNRFFSFACAGLIGFCAMFPAMAQNSTRTMLLSSPNPSAVGTPVAFWAKIDGLGGGPPTGWPSFWDGTTRLGYGKLSAIGAGQEILVGAYSHSCGVTSAGDLKCWGYNYYGQLGDGTTVQRLTPVSVSGLTSVVGVTAGQYHTCALKSSGAVYCWGYNKRGQLGNGSTTNRWKPKIVTGFSDGAMAISAGGASSCALTKVGGVKCWGYNYYGQLGDGTTVQRLTPVTVSGLTSGVVAIASGSGHSCALTKVGGVKCWGMNFLGALGDGTTGNRRTPVDVVGLSAGVVALTAGTYHTCALLIDGAVKCWGGNQYGQLGDRTTSARLTPVDVYGLTGGVKALSSGPSHVCALKASGVISCWGQNSAGQLGDGTSVNRLKPFKMEGLPSGIVAVMAGEYHSCALTEVGALWCVGGNGLGQLGDGTTTGRLQPVVTQNYAAILRARADFAAPLGTVGVHRIKFFYNGDATHGGSSSLPLSQTVE